MESWFYDFGVEKNSFQPYRKRSVNSTTLKLRNSVTKRHYKASGKDKTAMWEKFVKHITKNQYPEYLNQ